MLACALGTAFACADAKAASVVAAAKGSEIAVFGRPGGKPVLWLASPDRYGVARVLLVTERRRGWVKVLLPVRPNGASGWIRATTVRLFRNDYAVKVERRAHRLTVTQNGRPIRRLRVGVGSARTPTPLGRFYVTESLQILGAARDYYGPFALGRTGDPTTIGRDASNGCIHISNRDARSLATLLPLGTPVTIVR